MSRISSAGSEPTVKYEVVAEGTVSANQLQDSSIYIGISDGYVYLMDSSGTITLLYTPSDRTNEFSYTLSPTDNYTNPTVRYTILRKLE